MEDYKNQFVLILAGYPFEIDGFMATNPGLPSRFPMQMEFRDYSVDQLLRIADGMARERDYALPSPTAQKLRQLIAQEKADACGNFSNARYVRNVLERAIRCQAVRLLTKHPDGAPDRTELMTLLPEDVRGPHGGSTTQREG